MVSKISFHRARQLAFEYKGQRFKARSISNLAIINSLCPQDYESNSPSLTNNSNINSTDILWKTCRLVTTRENVLKYTPINEWTDFITILIFNRKSATAAMNHNVSICWA